MLSAGQGVTLGGERLAVKRDILFAFMIHGWGVLGCDADFLR